MVVDLNKKTVRFNNEILDRHAGGMVCDSEVLTDGFTLTTGSVIKSITVGGADSYRTHNLGLDSKLDASWLGKLSAKRLRIEFECT